MHVQQVIELAFCPISYWIFRRITPVAQIPLIAQALRITEPYSHYLLNYAHFVYNGLQFHCCGVHHPSDYEMLYGIGNVTVPRSCCHKNLDFNTCEAARKGGSNFQDDIYQEVRLN